MVHNDNSASPIKAVTYELDQIAEKFFEDVDILLFRIII